MTIQNSTSVAAIIAALRLVARRPQDPGTPGKFFWVDPNVMHIDHNSYQRETNEKHTIRIAEGYRFDHAKVISVFYSEDPVLIGKDGYPFRTYYVTDGQHSAIGAALAGIKKVPAYGFLIPPGSTLEQRIKDQSRQFIAINKSAKKIQKFDEFRNDLIQGEPYAIALETLCKKYNVELIPATSKKKRGTMSHIHNLQIAYYQIGADSIEFAFDFIRKFWPDDQVHGGLFIGLARFLKKFDTAQIRGVANSTVDLPSLFNALSANGTKSPKEADEWLKDVYFNSMAGNLANKADAWRAKAIRCAYNDWVDSMGLDTSRKLTTKAVG